MRLLHLKPEPARSEIFNQLEAVQLYQRCGYQPGPAFAGYPDNGLSLFLHKRLAEPAA